MNNINFVEKKYKDLISLSIKHMNSIDDYEHDNNHIKDVIDNILKLTEKIELDFDFEICILAGYWHDVGRTRANVGHEKISAEMLKEELVKLNYPEEFIQKCYDAIAFHKWNMEPKTIEGLIVKDADKLAWLGNGRWDSCLKNNQVLDELIKLLPNLRNEILYFEESKIIYDKLIVKIVEKIYNKVYE